jgi:hypothetical protein
MSIDLQDPVAVSPENVASAARWRQWQLRNVVTSRKDATRARIVFTVIFAVMGAWLGRLLLAPSL